MYSDINLDLKGLVRAKFSSITKLAKHLGWSISKTYRIVNGTQNADVQDIRQIAVALGLTTPADVVSVFCLLDCPQNGTTE